MAENKEITTLHPYMNRNKNRYPNVREENIPDTIQRRLTAGTGINISPENVISATGGDSYTRSETDALLATKADKVALENVNKAVPTDIAVKNGKLGLEHNTTWLTNQNAITLGDGLTYDEATKTLKVSGSKGGISVIELTDKNGTISSTQLDEINANPQNFAFKYNGKILLFTKADSTTYQYCNNTTNSSDNNVMTTSVLLTITSSTGAYTIAENVHNVVANSIHPANGGDLTNIQVGSKVYSIPSGGSNIEITTEQGTPSASVDGSIIYAGSYETGTVINDLLYYRYKLKGSNIPTYIITQWYFDNPIIKVGDVSFYLYIAGYQYTAEYLFVLPQAYCIKGGTVSQNIYLPTPTCKQRMEIRIK